MKKFNIGSNVLLVSVVIGLVLVAVVIATWGLKNIRSGKSLSAAAILADLSSADSFSVLAALSASSANTTTISGDLGLSPGLEVSRTGPWVVGGTEYFGPASAAFDAQADALIAFNDLAGQPSDGTWSLNPNPVPGVWTTASSATFAGPTLTLTGDYEDVWVFQIGADFTFTGSVVMAGNAQPCNVFWQVGGDATIASGSDFVGTLIASNNITLVSGATVDGRIISLNGALTTDNNTISGPTCVAPPPLPDPVLQVVKTIINDDGGAKLLPAEFSFFLDGVSVLHGVPNTTTVGAHVISETPDLGYTTVIGGDCAADGTITLALGDIKTCTISNDDIAAPVVEEEPSEGGGSSSGSRPRSIVAPLIDVVKVPNPLALPDGPGLVNYTYTLRNIGTVPVTDVTMVGDTCSPIVLASGDIDADLKLDTNETWTYRCSTRLSETHTNIITATGWANGISAVDVASATVVVGVPIIPPLIHVTKVPSPLSLFIYGGTVTYTNKVTNPGTVALSNVSVVDDKCGPVKYISGDNNRDSKLDTNETWTYVCSTELTKNTTNTVSVEGSANGLTAKDFAIATVLLSAPGLPKTGFEPK